MKRIIGFFVLALTLSTLLLAQDGGEKDKKRKRFLKNWGRFTPEVYVISKQERKAYRRLRSDSEREAFIIQFWEIRDPIYNTPQNEYRIEFERRVDWANVHLKSDSRSGWKTDMGMIFVLLGEANERRDVDGPDPRFPGELWIYRNRQGSDGAEEERFFFYYDLKKAGWYLDQGGRFDNAKFQIQPSGKSARRQIGLGDENNSFMPSGVIDPVVSSPDKSTGLNIDTSYGAYNLLQAQIGSSPNMVERRLRALIGAVGEERRSHFRSFGKTPGWSMQVGITLDGKGGVNLTCIARMRLEDASGNMTAQLETRPTQGGEGKVVMDPQPLSLCSVGNDHYFQVSMPLPKEGNHEFFMEIRNAEGETQGVGATVVGSVSPGILLEPGILPPMLFQTSSVGCFQVAEQGFSPVLGGMVSYTNNVALQVISRGQANKTYKLRVFPEWMSKGVWKLLPGTAMEFDVQPLKPEVLVLSDVLRDRIGEWRVRFELSEIGSDVPLANYTQFFVIQ